MIALAIELLQLAALEHELLGQHVAQLVEHPRAQAAPAVLRDKHQVVTKPVGTVIELLDAHADLAVGWVVATRIATRTNRLDALAQMQLQAVPERHRACGA
jgi:hypothetical protein